MNNKVAPEKAANSANPADVSLSSEGGSGSTPPPSDDVQHFTPKVVLGLLSGVVLLAASCYGTTQVVIANDFKDYAPTDSVAGDYFAKAAFMFPTQQLVLIAKEFDYHTFEGQQDLLDLIQAVRDTEYVGNRPGSTTTIWIESLRNYVSKPEVYNHDFGLIEVEGYKDLMIPEDDFYMAYNQWLAEPTVSLEVQLSLSATFNYKPVKRPDKIVNPKTLAAHRRRGELAYTQVIFFVHFDLTKDIYVEIVNMIDHMRALVDSAPIPAFVTSEHIIRHEILTHLEEILLSNLVIALMAVFFASFALSFDIFQSVIIMMLVMVCAVELYGIMGLCGINLNPAPVVSLIMSVGLTVEFIAHLTYAYFNDSADEAKPLEAAMTKVAVPIFHGAVSSILGIIMLGFSDYGFVVKYYFAIFLATILIGLVNGMIFQPALIRASEILMKK